MLLILAAILYPVQSFAFDHISTLTVLVRNTEDQTLSDLRESDFQIVDNGKTRRVSACLNLRPPVQLQSARPPEQYLVSNRPLAAFGFPQPTTVLLLDTRNTDPEFQPWLSLQAIRLVSFLRPGENLALWQLSRQGLKLLHQFSNGTQELADAIAPQAITKTAGKIKWHPERVQALEPDVAADFDQESIQPALRVQRDAATQTALIELANYLNQFNGRKNLVWMASDFSTGAALRALNKANIAVYPVEVRSEIVEEPFQLLSAGHLSNIPAHRRRSLSRNFQKAISIWAASTGGKAISNRSQLAEAIFDALQQTRFVYQLSFSVPDENWNGLAHSLQVRTLAKNASMLAKQIYYAESPAAALLNSVFDVETIGLSIHPEASGNNSGLQVYVAARDLQWHFDQDIWKAAINILVKEQPGSQTPIARETKIFTLTQTQHSALTEQTVANRIPISDFHLKQGLWILVRDTSSFNIGSVTLPAQPPREAGY